MTGADPNIIMNYSSAYSTYLKALKEFSGSSTYNYDLGSFICPSLYPYGKIEDKVYCNTSTTLSYNCVTGTWGNCVNNIQTRNDLPALNGGTPCDSSTRPCANCVLSFTNTGCVNGSINTVATVNSLAYNGGTCSYGNINIPNIIGTSVNVGSYPCTDCTMSAWSGWSTCSVPCGGGTQSQTRSVITEASGGTCPVNNIVGTIERQTQACNTQPCPVFNNQITTSGTIFSENLISAPKSRFYFNILSANGYVSYVSGYNPGIGTIRIDNTTNISIDLAGRKISGLGMTSSFFNYLPNQNVYLSISIASGVVTLALIYKSGGAPVTLFRSKYNTSSSFSSLQFTSNTQFNWTFAT